MNQLIAIIRQQPDLLDRLEREIRGLDSNSPNMMTQAAVLIGSLGHISSPESESLLVDLLGEDQIKTIHFQTVSAIGNLDEPSLHSSKALLEYYENSKDSELQSMVLLALGTASYKQKTSASPYDKAMADIRSKQGGAPADSREAVEFIAKKASEDPNRAHEFLGAMGNSGDPSFLPFIETALKSKDQTLRVRSVYQLRKLENEAARQVLLNVIMDDQDENVREEGLKALYYHSPSFDGFEAACKLFRQLEDGSLKIKSLVLAYDLGTCCIGELRAFLEENIENTPDGPYGIKSKQLLRNLDSQH